jgi:hypothetical protein
MLHYARREHRYRVVRLGGQRPAQPLGHNCRLSQTQAKPTAGLRHQYAKPAQFCELLPLCAIEFGTGLRQRPHPRQIGSSLDEVAYALCQQGRVTVVIIPGHIRRDADLLKEKLNRAQRALAAAHGRHSGKQRGHGGMLLEKTCRKLFI